MRYVAAYLLAVMGGNNKPSQTDLSNILASVGVDCDAALAKRVIDEMSGKDLQTVLSEGREKLASMPSGGGGGAAVSAAPGAGGATETKEEKKEEKKEESEESDDDMGFGLFD